MISRERPVDPIEEAALAAGAAGRRTGVDVLAGFWLALKGYRQRQELLRFLSV